MSLQSVIVMQVVISPHVYGPSISMTTNKASGTALWTRLSQSFGYLNKAGFGNHVFAIAIGEFGTTFAEEADQTLFADLAKYMLNVQDDGSPVDELHNPITSFFWFAWNANSGDTGGLVTSPDWDSIVWPKVEYLQGLGLQPWYTGAPPATTVAGAGSPATPVDTDLSPLAPATPESPVAPTTDSPGSEPASPANPPDDTPAPLAPLQMPCTVEASYTTVWEDPTYGPYMTSVSLLITNAGSETVPVPWTVSVSSAAAYSHVKYSWNWKITGEYDGSTVSGVATQEWLAIQPGANAVNLGYVAGSSRKKKFIPASVSINGRVCEWA